MENKDILTSISYEVAEKKSFLYVILCVALGVGGVVVERGR